MWDDIKSAACAGVLLGVKYGVMLLVIALCLSWLMGDYTVTKQNAARGQQAFEFLAKMNQQQQPARPSAPEGQ